MNRILIGFNFLGVALLCVLSVHQWRVAEKTQSQIDRVTVENRNFKQTIVELHATISDQSADLSEYRDRLKSSEDLLKDVTLKLQVATRERDDLATALPKWQAAVTARDAVIRQATTQISTLMESRDDAIKHANEAATRYNDLVKRVQESQK